MWHSLVRSPPALLLLHLDCKVANPFVLPNNIGEPNTVDFKGSYLCIRGLEWFDIYVTLCLQLGSADELGVPSGAVLIFYTGVLIMH